MTTLTDEELGTVTNDDVSTDDKVYRGIFEGRLVGTATTAKQLEVPFKLELQGDVTGNVDISGKQGVILQTTVSHATEADRAEYAGKTALATNANYADLANLANYAVESGKAKQAEYADEAEHAKETDHALNSDKSLQADNASNAKESEHSVNSDNSLHAVHAVQADTDGKERNIADTFDAILYTDLPTIRTDIVNITPTEHTVEFKDKEYKLRNTLLADEDNENKLLQDFSNSIEDVDNRITNLETTTDLGNVAVRLSALEQKDIELKSEIDANTNNISSNTTSISKNTTDISELKQTVDNNKTASDNQFNTINSDISSLQSTSANHALSIEQNTSSITSLNSEVSKVRNDFESADTTINERVNSIESNLDNYQLKSDAVKTVNGINPDEQGNVQLGNIGVITGEIKWFAFNAAPECYLVCNGASVSRETYADLFAVIGTTYGSGDGSTTFNIPDLRDRYIIGANTNALGTQIAEQLPNIQGHQGFLGWRVRPDSSGALHQSGSTYKVDNNNNGDLLGYSDTSFNASWYNSVYTDNGHVYPLSLALLPCIKY